MDTDAAVPGVRWVLAGTVQGWGMMPAFKPERMYTLVNGKRAELGGYFAVAVDAEIGPGAGNGDLYAAGGRRPQSQGNIDHP